MANCDPLYPSKDLLYKTKRQCQHIVNVATSNAASVTNPDGGRVDKTLSEWERLFSDELGRVTIVNSGNWSTVAGQPIEEADRFKGYAYPDDSDNIYAVRGSVTLPITRPSTPIGDDRFYLASAVNVEKMRSEAASQLGLVYQSEWAPNITIPANSKTNKYCWWQNDIKKFITPSDDASFATSSTWQEDVNLKRFTEITTARSEDTIYKSDAVVDMKKSEVVASMYSGGREFTSKSRPVITNSAETLINHTYRTNCDGFDVDANYQGVGTALGTNNTQQSTWTKTSNMLIKNQRFGVWKRYSIWEDYDNLSLKGNTCGIRLARSEKQSDNSNPVPTQDWNYWNNGFFHNVIKMNNVLCEGGEVGIYGSLMCGSLDNITCQGQVSDGSANNVLPDGLKGTGIYLENGKNESKLQSWNNSIRSYYCENTINGIKLDNRQFTDINGYFYQPPNSISGTALILDNSYVMMRGFCAQGTGKIADLTKGSVLVNEGKANSGLIGTKYTYDATSQVYARGQCDLPFSRYTININSGSAKKAFTLPTTLNVESRYSVSIIATYDGYLSVSGNATIYRHLGNNYSVEIHPKITVSSGNITSQTDLFSLSDGFEISVVANKITLTMKSVATRSIRLSVQVEEVCGTTTVLNAPEILGVNV